MKIFTLLFNLFLFCILATNTLRAQETLATWTFDELLAAPNTAKVIASNVDFGEQKGTAFIYLDGTNGSSDWLSTSSSTELTTFGGTTNNDPRTPSVAGNALTLTNSTANTKSIVLKLSTLEKENLQLTFSTRGTSSGFDNHEWSYSIDGNSFIPFAVSNTVNKTSTWETRTIDFNSTPDLINKENIWIKLKVDGATSASGNNRLDNIVIKGTSIGSTTPLVTFAPSSFDYTQVGTSNTKKVTINGSNLTQDLTLSTTGDFSVTPTTITVAQAASGVEIDVIFTPTAKGNRTGSLIASSTDFSTSPSVALSGSAYNLIEAASIADLRAQYTGTSISDTRYKLNGEAFVTFEYTKNRGQYYIQDATGAIVIDDATGKISTQFTAGDGMTNLQGTFSTYGVLQFVPTEDATKTTSGNVVTPKLITPTQLATGDYESQLIKIDGITVEGTGKFEARTNYTVTNETFQIRTFDLTYDAEISAVKNIIGIAGKYTTGTPATTTYQIYPRSDADLINVPTAIETPTLGEGSVFVSNGQIVVKAETAGALIEVYNIAGQRLVSQVAEAGRNTFTLAKGQIYVVKIGNLVKKVVL